MHRDRGNRRDLESNCRKKGSNEAAWHGAATLVGSHEGGEVPTVRSSSEGLTRST